MLGERTVDFLGAQLATMDTKEGPEIPSISARSRYAAIPSPAVRHPSA